MTLGQGASLRSSPDPVAEKGLGADGDTAERGRKGRRSQNMEISAHGAAV